MAIELDPQPLDRHLSFQPLDLHFRYPRYMRTLSRKLLGFLACFLVERILQILLVFMQQNISPTRHPDSLNTYTAFMIKAGRPPKRDRPEFGQRMAEARERAGLTQSELAKKQPNRNWQKNLM
jgi:hypothetical protein